MKMIRFQEIIFININENKIELHIEEYNDGTYSYCIIISDKNKLPNVHYIKESEQFFDNPIDSFKQAIKKLEIIFDKNEFVPFAIDNPFTDTIIKIDDIKKLTNHLKMKEYRVNGKLI
jgi:hypothetical protein